MDNLDFESLTAEELDEYLENHEEKDFLLIDVRQESEYELGHIPGAQLMPLSEVETKLFSLPAERDLIFYCHNGGRSQWAASLVGEGEVCQKNVYHLMGGLLVRNGPISPGYPKVQLFDKSRELEHLLTTAMDLEKGAWRFYLHAMESFPDDPIHPIFEQLSIAERGHAQLIYHFFQRIASNPQPFEILYDSLKGEILEGGQSLYEACRNLAGISANPCAETLDLALSIEYAAYDLYRAMAEQTDLSEARQTFLAIAQAEKGHMRVLVRVIEKCRA